MMSREIAEDLGCIYWEDFFKGVRGNRWRLMPSEKMVATFEIYQLSRTLPNTHEDGTVEGWGNAEVQDVLFDRAYVEAYAVKYKSLTFALQSLLVIPATKPEDTFKRFEESYGLVLSSKNPRHSLYLKFKEFSNDSKN